MIYQFEEFSLDPDAMRLSRNGHQVTLEPQVFEVLAVLVSRHEQLVTKQDLIDLVWGGRFVSDSALSSRIKTARQIIGDDGKQQRLIRTVHGRGFRFVGEVHATEPSAFPAPSSTPPSSQPSVAVLPFENLSSDPDQGYLANGLTQDIGNILARHRWLQVLSVNALRPFLAQANLYQALGQEAGVDYVVEGSVRRAGERLRVATALVSTERGQTHWSESYDRAVADVFALQDEIATTIVSRIEPEIGQAERQRVVQLPPRDLHAWECFHLGVDQFFKFTADANVKAQALLQQSRSLDPQFAEAHDWWAYSVVLGMVYWNTAVSQEALDEALRAAEQAVQTDNRNAVLYTLMARVRLARGEYSAAIRENQRAIELNPALASAHCGLADSLAYEGRLDESIATFEHVIQLSTNDPQRWAFFTYGALAMIFQGDYERAVQWCDEAMLLPNRQYWTLAHKMVALAHMDRLPEAQVVQRELMGENPAFDLAFVREKLFYLKRADQLEVYLAGLARLGFS